MLRELTIEITQQCPMHCIICSSDSGEKNHNELSFAKLKTIVDDAKSMGLKTIVLSGGEPLECGHALDFIQYVKENGIELHLYSCGNMRKDGNIAPLSDSLLGELKHLNVDKIIFSIHGHNQKIHESITTKNGSFSNLITSILNAKKFDLPIELHFVPVLQNYKFLPQIVQLAINLEIPRISILRFVPQGRGLINRGILEITQEQVLELRDILQHILLTSLIEVRIGAPFNCLNIGTLTHCSAGIDKATIRPDGFVFPCVSMKKIGLIKKSDDIAKSNIINIWNYSESFKDIRKLHEYTSKSCNFCENLNCMSGCLTQNYINCISNPNKDEYCIIVNRKNKKISNLNDLSEKTGGVPYGS
jgi:MoaA/NifB/PqqE/SkfB family radical SAM enzyme